MKKSLLIFFSALVLIVTISAMSFNSNFFKTKVFEFDKTTTQAQLDQLQVDMLKSGIKMEFKALKFNQEGRIDFVDVHLKHSGGFSRFCSEDFESARIEKRIFGMKVVVNGQSEEDLWNE
jgi:hypothetical protein